MWHTSPVTQTAETNEALILHPRNGRLPTTSIGRIRTCQDSCHLRIARRGVQSVVDETQILSAQVEGFQPVCYVAKSGRCAAQCPVCWSTTCADRRRRRSHLWRFKSLYFKSLYWRLDAAYTLRHAWCGLRWLPPLADWQKEWDIFRRCTSLGKVVVMPQGFLYWYTPAKRRVGAFMHSKP